MALVITKRLCSLTLRSRLLPRVSTHSYHCYILTKLDFEPSRKSLIPVQSIACYKVDHTFYGALRQYSTGSKNDEQKNKDGEKLSLFKRFKQMYRDYWYVLVPVHIVTSAAWFGGFYYLAVSGFDIPALLESMNFNEKIVNSMRNSSMGYVAITYGLYKIATPVRYALTLGGTTISIQYLKQWGYIKPIPSTERLKEMYVVTKEGMKEKRENLMESVHNLKETVKETKEGIKDKKDSLVSTVKGSKENIKKKVISSTTHKAESKS